MEHLAIETMLGIMSRSCGIEEEEKFFQTALSEIHDRMESKAEHLFTEGKEGYVFQQVATYPDNHPTEYIIEAVSRFGDAETGKPDPIFEKTSDGSILFLPLKHQKSPLMVLCLQWEKATPPPAWILDKASLSLFNSKLAEYLPWKYVLLKIATAKRHLEAVFDHMPGAISVLRSDYTIERINKSFSKLYNVTFNDAIGRKCYEIVHKRASAHEACPMPQVIQDGKRKSIEIQNGSNFRITYFPLVAHNGETKSLQMILNNNDMTSQRSGPSFDFLQLYNLLSQPLTVLSLISGMALESHGSNTSEYIQIIRQEVDSIMRILKEIYTVVQGSQEMIVR